MQPTQYKSIGKLKHTHLHAWLHHLNNADYIWSSTMDKTHLDQTISLVLCIFHLQSSNPLYTVKKNIAETASFSLWLNPVCCSWVLYYIKQAKVSQNSCFPLNTTSFLWSQILQTSKYNKRFPNLSLCPISNQHDTSPPRFPRQTQILAFGFVSFMDL